MKILAVILLISILCSACEPLDLDVQGHTITNYKEARTVFWSQLYPEGGSTLYCDENFDSGRPSGINIEHVFPMSWVTNGLKCGTRSQCRERSDEFNLIEADLHNLYPARTAVNSARGSFRFGEVRGEQRDYGASCDFEVNHRVRVVEPRPAVRGEIARAMFYMAFKYHDQGLEIFSRSGKILQQWHNEDPPTEAERHRNEQIHRLQGSRNIFIDEPEKLNQLIAQGFFY